jgi:acyl transferase domain-containing protein/acyl carrier protein
VDIPVDRWDVNKFYNRNREFPETTLLRQGGFLQQAFDVFDPEVFGISPREAGIMDPQQRWLLESVWEAIEDAGWTVDSIRNSRAGVFVGGFTLDNLLTQLGILGRDRITPQTSTSSTMVMLSNRISYIFDLTGPSLTMDTACSSSLVAIHQAAQSIWSGESEWAIAGGVNAILSPEFSIAMTKGKFLASDSRSRSFGSDGDGYGRGEGAAVLILKPLSKAIRDGDSIHGTILATGCNQDGRTSALTVPNMDAQTELMRRVVVAAGIEPSEVGYVEAHGTGTPTGDPIEFNAIQSVFAKTGEPTFLGSIKSNVGHLEAAAGVAGVLKALLAAKNGKIPRSLHSETINPAIAIEGSGLEVPQRLTEFPQSNGRMIAAINSFGYGGTNANAIVSSYSPMASEAAVLGGKGEVLAHDFGLCAHLSAQSWDAISDLSGRYADFLKERPEVSAKDLISTLAYHRSHLDKRVSISVRDRSDLIQKLSEVSQSREWDTHVSASVGSDLRTAFVYTGMGPQWWAMGRQLLETDGVFQRAIRDCDDIFQHLSGWSIRSELLKEASASRVESTEVAQPLNFALQYALTQVMLDCGIRPDAVVGHSVGEVASAAISGALSLEDALQVSYHRSRLQQQTARLGGGMLAIGMSELDALQLIEGSQQVSIAAVNGPGAVTLSGSVVELEALAASLSKRSIFNRQLRVEIAYHSSFMDELKESVYESLAAIRPQPAKIPLYSTVSGTQISGESLDAAFWWNNIRQPVRFMSAINEMGDAGYNRFVELGPHPALGGSIRECLLKSHSTAQVYSTLNRKVDDHQALLDCFSNLHCSGLVVNWTRLLPRREFVRIPQYAWQRKPMRNETQRTREYLSGRGKHPFLNESMRGTEPGFLADLNLNYFPWLVDHRIRETVLFPGAGFIECGLAICREEKASEVLSIEAFKFIRFLEWNESSLKRLHTSFDRSTGKIRIFSQVGSDEPIWTQHAEARVLTQSVYETAASIDIEACFAQLDQSVQVDEFYSRLADMGLHYGPSFRRIEALSHDGCHFIAKLRPSDEALYSIHPAVLDASFQAVFAPILEEGKTRSPALPVGVDRIDLFDPHKNVCYVSGEVIERTSLRIKANLSLYDASGNCVARLRGATFQEFSEDRKLVEPSRLLYELKWSEAPKFQLTDALKEKRWLLVGDFTEVGTELIDIAKTQGIAVDWVLPGDIFTVDGAIISFDLTDRSSWEHFRETVVHSYDRIVFLDSLIEAEEVYERELTLIESIVYLANVWMATLPEKPQLTVLTRGAVAVSATETVTSLCGSSLSGICYVLGNEISGVQVRQIDLAADGVLSAILFESIVDSSGFERLAVRGETRYVERLEKVRPEVLARSELSCGDVRLSLQTSPEHGIDSIYYLHEKRQAPEGKEIEIEVETTCLNFKDLLKVQGKLGAIAMSDTYFGDSIGMECLGRVVRIGSDHQDLVVGQQCVFTVKGGAFASFVTFEPQYWLPIPDSLKPKEALIVVPYMTALHALEDIARLEKGERVLIHGACGAVGLAAIQVCQAVGAEIFATAGSEDKRTWLRSKGVSHIYDSRSLAFSDQIRDDTEGYGVDVVLNSIAGEAFHLSLQLLAPHGRFIEIGKKDIVEDKEIGLRLFNQSIQFACIDMDRILRDKPKLSKDLIQRIYDGFQLKVYHPMPITSFSASKTKDAFSYLSRSQQIGKVVVDFGGESILAHSTIQIPIASGKGAYLITGGTKGLGLELAKQLALSGAGAIYLVSRGQELSAEAHQAVDEMRACGSLVEAVSCDVSDAVSVQALKDQIAAGSCPLKGIVHAAMVLDDSMLDGVSNEQLHRVLLPKLKGALLLHGAFELESLDYFVLLSSISSLVGNAGQAAYVAANSALDSFSHYRRGLGLPSTTINLGVVRDVGVVARSGGAMADNLDQAGLLPMGVDQIFEGLKVAINSCSPQVGLFEVQWDALMTRFPELNRLQRFEQFATVPVGSGGKSSAALSIAALEPDEQHQRIMESARSALVQILRLSPASTNDSKSLNQLGLDSLMGMELSIKLTADLGFPVSTNDLSSQLNLDQIAVNLMRKIRPAE